MTQRTTGLHSILSLSWAYDLFQNLVGGNRMRRWLIDEVIDPVPGQRILDIGCGTATILDFLPDVEYLGIDLSSKYIESATRRFRDRGRFVVASSDELASAGTQRFSTILALALLHHLDDAQVERLFCSASRLLEADGRLVTIDGTFVPRQHPVSRWLIKNDRGLNVRTPDELRSIAERVFSRVTVQVKNNLLRIPYTHVILECQNE